MYTKRHQERLNEWMTVLLFGVLSAIAGNFHLQIPGLGGGVTDPREVVALSSVFFLRDWKSALMVGILASFGGPYNDTMPVTLLMHVLAIPAAWFLYQLERRYIKEQFFLILLWAILVIVLYLGVYLPAFVVGTWLIAKISVQEWWITYQTILGGIRLEIAFTTITTSLVLALRLNRAKLNREALLLNLFIRSTEFGIWEWDTIEDKFTLNYLWQKKLGLNIENNGTSIQRFVQMIHPDDRAVFENKVKDLLEGKTTNLHAEYRLLKNKEECCWVFNSAQFMKDEIFGTDTKKVVGILMDTTEQKLAEQENERLQQQLIQAQKMESIGTLAGGIAHDFNNLLTVINGHVELAMNRVESSHTIQKDLRAVQTAGQKAVQLTSQLLAFSRRQIYEPRTININNVVNELHKMLARLIGEDIHIEMVLRDSLPSILADPVQIEQVLLNLVVNARDAINESTEIAGEKKITIETDRADLKSTYQNSVKHKGEFVVLSVSDSGRGMDKETLDHVFEPFFTTKEKGKGTGLGLSTVYGIVQQNKGHISVYSEPGVGTTFKIYWPASEDDSEPEEEQLHDVTRLSGNEKILYVEDDSMVREFTISVLSGFGYTVYSTANGAEAYQMVRDGNIRPDLILTDLIMPEMNGRELADKIKGMLPDCPVLYTSGYTDNHIVHNGSLEKDVNFLHKPFSSQQLLRKIRKILDK